MNKLCRLIIEKWCNTVKPGKIFMFFLCVMFASTGPSYANPGSSLSISDNLQTSTVSGKVTNEKGEAIPGVSVVIKGTTSGTITDIDGNYKIEVNTDAILAFSFIGYQSQEVKVGASTTINIVLVENAKLLDEVVVVGYGTQRKGTVLASISSVRSKDIARSNSTTVASSLVGKVPGVTYRQVSGTPGSSTDLQIRNMGTPLYVIDGVIQDAGQFNNLDMNDIDNISVVKDGSSAIYGFKASNGVVLVTTKRGKLGEKPIVSMNIYQGWQSWTRFPTVADAYNYQRAVYEGQVISNIFKGNVDDTKKELENWKNGTYDPANNLDYRGYDYSQYARTNVPQQYLSVNVSGGTNKTNYYFSMSGINQESVFKDFDFNRKNFQTNVDSKITDYLKVGISMNGRIENRTNPATGGSGTNDYNTALLSLYQNLPTVRPYANDNELYPNKLAQNGSNPETINKDYTGYYNDTWKVFQGSWNLEYTTPVKGLKATALFSYYYASDYNERFFKSFNTYTYDPLTSTYNIAYTNTNTQLAKMNQTIDEKTYQFKIDYDNSFGKNNISAVFASEAQNRVSRSLQVINGPLVNNFIAMLPNLSPTGKETVNDVLTDYSTAGFIGRFSYDYDRKYMIELSGRYDGTWKFVKDNRWAFFPSVAVGYRVSEEKYFKESFLGKTISNLKLRFSYGQMGDVNLGALYPDFAYTSGYQYDNAVNIYGNTSGMNSGYHGAVISADPFNSVPGNYYIGSNPKVPITNLTWIKSSITNVGIDLGFFNNRLTSEFDGFYRKRDGLPATRADLQLPAEVGFTTPPENLNSDKIYGIDGFVKWTDKIGEIQYSVGGNATLARRMLGDRYGEIIKNSWDEYRNSSKNRWASADPASNAWSSTVTGQFMTQEEIDMCLVEMDANGNRNMLPGDFVYQDLNGDGRMDGFDERPNGYDYGSRGNFDNSNSSDGKQLPIFTYGINLGLEWKGLDFAADLAGASMQTFIYDGVTKWPYHFGNSPDYILNDRWHHEDIFDPSSPWVQGTYPALRKSDPWGTAGGDYRRWNTFYMTNVKYFRLRNLVLGYTIPGNLTKKAYISKCRIYFSGTNLFSIDNIGYRGLDPEVGNPDGYNYPQNKVYTIGANVTF